MVYKVFELNVLSNDISLPELNTSNDYDYQIEIVKNKNLFFKNAINNNYKYIYKNLLINEDELFLHISDIADFKVIAGDKIIWNNFDCHVSEESIRAYILGSAIGAILIQRDNLVLHANALTKDSKTIICMGNTGAGKSTLAYSLMSRGWNLLSDDLVAVTDDFSVLPGIPRIKLWDDAVSYFHLNMENLKRVRVDMNKFQLSGNDVKSSYRKSKINAIYILENNSNKIVKSQIFGEKNKLCKVLNNLYRPLYIKGFNKEANYFKKITKLIKDIPIYSLSLPRSLSKMERWLDLNEL